MTERRTRPQTRRTPATRQRSPWIQQPENPAITAAFAANGHGAWVPAEWRRNVSDGVLTALVGEEPEGWHLSISHTRGGKPGRYPTWDEQADARDMLLPADVAFVMHLPTESSYVSDHPTTFHWHEHPMRSQVEAQQHSDDNDLLVAAALIKELHAVMRRALALLDGASASTAATESAARLLEEHLPEIDAESAVRVDARPIRPHIFDVSRP